MYIPIQLYSATLLLESLFSAYQCLAFIDDENSVNPLEQYLITKSVITGEINCWVCIVFIQ